MIHSDLRGIRPLERDGLMMKTPVLTGRRDSVESKIQFFLIKT
jgi:hypothetical protein